MGVCYNIYIFRNARALPSQKYIISEDTMADLKMLAIDLGASSGRGIVGSFDGSKLELRENHRFANDPVFVNGRFTWDILRIFFEIKNSINFLGA